MKNWYRFQSLLNDILGAIVLVWGAVLLTIRQPDWCYVAMILIGGSMVVGKQVVSSLPGMGGGPPDDRPEKLQG